jgi:hypothetical protein
MRYLARLFNYVPKKILQSYFQKQPNHLGRWSNDCNIKTNKKIDFANEDHCGPCGSSHKDKVNK